MTQPTYRYPTSSFKSWVMLRTVKSALFKTGVPFCLPCHSCHTQIGPIHQGDAIRETGYGDKSSINPVDDLALFGWTVFLVVVDIVECRLTDILDFGIFPNLFTAGGFHLQK